MLVLLKELDMRDFLGSIVDVQKADVRRTLAQLIASLALLGLDDACILQESDDLADITGIGTDAGCYACDVMTSLLSLIMVKICKATENLVSMEILLLNLYQPQEQV